MSSEFVKEVKEFISTKFELENSEMIDITSPEPWHPYDVSENKHEEMSESENSHCVDNNGNNQRRNKKKTYNGSKT